MWFVLSLSTLLSRTCKFNLDTVDTIHAVDEEDKDEDEGYLLAVRIPRMPLASGIKKSIPSCRTVILRRLDFPI